MICQRCMKDVNGIHTCTPTETWREMEQRIAELEMLNAELRNDAERYRWLRDGNAYFPEEEMIEGGVELDEAIDANAKGGA